MGSDTSIAIIGMAGRFPGAANLGEFWSRLRAGAESIRFFSEEELRRAGVPEELLRDPNYVRASGFLEGVDQFDAAFFGMSPRDAAIFDPQHRLFLECAWTTFEDAGYVPGETQGPVGVFASAGMNDYLTSNLLRNPALVASVGEWLIRHTGNDPNFLATRVSYELNLRGPSLSVQTACSSSLVAVHLACQSLLSGECDLALAGGSSVTSRQLRGYLYSEGEILSPDGHCRPFDARAQGTVFSSACGAVLLKRLADAVRDGDHIRAVILGTAINNDGAEKVGYLAPSVDGQARVVTEALSLAGVSPRDISYVEAHGTGTLLGDPIELAALHQAFGRAAGHRCAIGSVKSNLGHAGEAASIAGLIKTVLALEHREIPPTLHFEKPNPQARMEEGPFWVADRLLPWESAGPLRAGVTGLGAGGTNAHAVLEEGPPAPNPAQQEAPSRAQQLVVVSGRTATAADAAVARLAAHFAEPLAGAPPSRLADAAFTLQVGRKAFAHRRAVVASSVGEAALALRDPARLLSGQADRARPVAFLFPGGGAQYARMGFDLHRSEPIYRAALEECLAASPGLREALFPAASDETASRKLESPALALPALFATEYALCKLLESFGLTPAAVIGHSAGEYAAACIAGVLTPRDALGLVALRGRLFERLPPGGMTSVPLPEAELRALLPSELSIAAVNGPSLCVASGPLAALLRLEADLLARSIETSRIHIDVAAHSAMVTPILPAFAAQCRATRFSAPRLPFVSNLTGTWARSEDVTDPDYWVRHLREPVRFAEGMRTLLAEPDRLLAEIGPGRTLASLARKLGAGQAEPTLRHPQESADDGAFLLGAVGRLWTRGAQPDWQRMAGGPRRRVPLPTYPFEGKRHWIEPTESAQPAAASLRKRPDVGDWFSAPCWQRDAGADASSDAAASGPWLLLDSGDALGDAVARALAGAKVVRVRPGSSFERRGAEYRLRPGNRRDLDALYASLGARDLEPRCILHLLAAGKRGGRDDAAAFQLASEIYEGLAALGQIFASSSGPVRLVVATSGLFAVGAEPVLAPERALLIGPVLVLPRELPEVRTALIDVDAPARGAGPVAEVAAALVREGLGQQSGELVAVRGGSRWVRRLAPLRLSPVPGKPWVEPGSAVLITGGLGGLGLCVAERLARAGPIRLALLGRSKPTEAQRQRLRALEGLGAELITLQADTSDEASLRLAVEAARRRFGRLDAVLHAAGSLRDAPVAARAAAEGRAVIEGKALGALLLEKVLAGQPPALLVLFSSVSAVLGLPGQLDYTAANAFLDAFAESRAGSRTRVVSIGWSAWREIGLAVASLEAGAFSQPLSRERSWVVGEHVVRGGEAVLPGTGILELFAQSLGPRPEGSAIELREVVFIEPFVVEQGAEARAFVQRRGDELTLHAGQPDQPSATARGGFRPLEPERRHDADALRARCSLRVLGQGGTLEQSFMQFGPRWSSVKRIGLGSNEALIELELPAAFAADLAEHPLHPALLDLATGAAQALSQGFVAGRDFFVPLSYEKVSARAPLPARLFSHLRLRPERSNGELVFDAALFDESGRELLEVIGYTLRRVGEHGLTRGGRKSVRPSKAPGLREAAVREGIKPAEGLDALDRIVAARAGSHVLASSLDLETWKQSIAAKPARPKPAAPVDAAAGGWQAPRTEMERELAELWRELLGVERPGLTDNFFDLGGESLIAVRMSVRLRRKLGVELPLGALFEAPTLAACAALLDRARGVIEPSSQSDAPSSLQEPWRYLVCIQKGNERRSPFFCVHGAGGNVMNLRDLALGLSAAQPFWGVQARGLDGVQKPHATVEEAAEAYLAEVRRLQPHGPYLLGGYSGGGVVAYEMAQRLTSAGEAVGLLAFIDTFSPLMRNAPPDLRTRLGRVREEGLAYLPRLLERRRGEREDRLTLDRLRGILVRGEEVPQELRGLHLYVALGDAIGLYRPRPWSGRALLFRATTNYTFTGGGHSYGWDTLMPERVEVHECPGDHHDLLLGTNAAVLLRTLHEAIERAQPRG